MKEVSANRIAPPIPDHTVFRRIGRGSYGEVWLARGVTGAWRGVKVVYRNDFEDERSFEREFEGILAYEPLSRRCEGLVQILHVGRNRTKGFYYYVMELGDDDTRGSEINPVDYQPKTLRGDLLKKATFSWRTIEKISWQLADAIAFLHEHSLVHRDIKPANVIFVDGVAKLADIGLVAALGQRTFVGTEGFTPPEGPGQVQGDVYALGKVIYEMATGRDRMDFPAPPAHFQNHEHRKRWQNLDLIICKACHPNPKRRYRDGRAFERATSALLQGENPKQFRFSSIWKEHKKYIALVVGMVALVVWGQDLFFSEKNQFSNSTVNEVNSQNPSGQENLDKIAAPASRLRIYSFPEGAEILFRGEVIGNTSEQFFFTNENALPGEKVEISLRLDGYREVTVSREMPKLGTVPLGAVLEHWTPPKEGEFWVNSFGMEFHPIGNIHSSKLPLTASFWQLWPGASDLSELEVEQFFVSGKDGRQLELVAMDRANLELFLSWLEQQDQTGGYLGENHYYYFKPLTSMDLQRMGYEITLGQWPSYPVWSLRVSEYQGEIHVSTGEIEAKVLLDGIYVGSTPLYLEALSPGKYMVEVQADGYEDWSKEVDISARNDVFELHADLIQGDGLLFGRVWKNSLEQTFLPINENFMAAETETTVQAYNAYLSDLRGVEFIDVSEREGNFPVTEVNRAEARAFAEWLTQKERSKGLIGESQRYRLPTDREWSLLAQLEEELASPADLDGLLLEYSWGEQWPPPLKAANLGVPSRDIYVGVAPVGMFHSNSLGLKDISGNVWEWVSDSYAKDGGRLGVVRGGSFLTENEMQAYLSARNPVPPLAQTKEIGFRLILEQQSLSQPNQQEQTSEEALSEEALSEEGKITEEEELDNEFWEQPPTTIE